MAVVPMHSFIQNEAGHLDLVSLATIRSTQQCIVHPKITQNSPLNLNEGTKSV